MSNAIPLGGGGRPPIGNSVHEMTAGTMVQRTSRSVVVDPLLLHALSRFQSIESREEVQDIGGKFRARDIFRRPAQRFPDAIIRAVYFDLLIVNTSGQSRDCDKKNYTRKWQPTLIKRTVRVASLG